MKKQITGELEGRSIVYRIINAICVTFLTIMILDVTVIVAGRFLFHNTPGWGEPVALFCVIWFSLLSPANALMDDRHLRVTYFMDRFSVELQEIMNILFYIIFIIVALFMIIIGGALTWQTRHNMVAGIAMSQAMRYAAIPFSGFALLYAILYKIKHGERI